MTNVALGESYIARARARLPFLQQMAQAGLHADVVRGCQEVVELALKGIARMAGLDPPREHDIGNFLAANRNRLPPSLAGRLRQVGRVSKKLRRERELAFYGGEDFIPSEEYDEEDAAETLRAAEDVVLWVEQAMREIESR